MLLVTLLVACGTGLPAKQKPLTGTPPGGAPSREIPEPPASEAALIRSDYAKGEITQLCDQAIQQTDTALKEIGSLSGEARTNDNTIQKLEAAVADLGDLTSPLTFMGYVSEDAEMRKEATACEAKLGEFGVDIYTRKALYLAIKDLRGRDADEQRLLNETKKSFEQNGLKLSDEKLAEVKKLMQELSKLETQFSTNLTNDATKVAFTAAELEGVSESFLKRLPKDDAGVYTVTTKSTDYLQVMENAKQAETRKRMLMAYSNRQGEVNTKLLEQAILLRQQIAKVMGYATWADYRTSQRMSKSAKNVRDFLQDLRKKVQPRLKKDLAQLLAFKKTEDSRAKKVEAWDINYLMYQVKKRDFQLDDELIREYFPAEVVMKGMFETYSTLLGVEFIEEPDAIVWYKDVKLYRIVDKATKQTLSYFYTDFTPRQGKYGHAAAFTLIQGRERDGVYSRPVSSIVANFNPPADGKPSLMNHDEVETTFHEFGHIMHQTLTRGKYASLAGSSVARDFVEAPSQMLENWVWTPEILAKLSGHYRTGEKLPAELLKQMLAVRDFGQGYHYSRQIMLGLTDLTMHTASGKVDVTRNYDRLYEEVLGVKPLAGGRFVAGFGHMMGGYDAGYYGYLWSEVYAMDMFSVFEAGGLLNPELGAAYRRHILEAGNMKDAMDILKAFLGREPSNQRFLEKLGIQKAGSSERLRSRRSAR